ncbi:hypothetical protein DFH08DRAFT_826080 [Mycena albidolilacea]|uniref:Uncharacterized protein n=1 Tax=Mycena albidolilacea TaxID=1033008 RepID=A0AAD7E8K0_9AGAR|nr:hypothetical protein DFH08DRAFT_826080 [Mycena albidolilacea]
MIRYNKHVLFNFIDDMVNTLHYPIPGHHNDLWTLGRVVIEAQNSAAHQFDLSIGLKSPSPDLPLEEELRRQEEKDIKEAMHRSARDTEQARRRATFQDIIDTVTQPSPPPVPTTNLRLCSLSPSPDPPATVLPILHVKKHSTAPIQITKQLSNNWIKLSSTFHVTAPLWRPPTNPELVCRPYATWELRTSTTPAKSYHIFMKVSQGVRVLDEATIITRFLGRSTSPTSSHLHYGLSQEHAGPMLNLLVQYTSGIPPRHYSARAPISVNTTIVPTNIDDNSDTSTQLTPPLTTPPLTTPPLTPDISCSSAAGSKNNKDSWMKGLYVVDMVDRFVKMDSPKLMHLLTKVARFHAVFG